MPASEKLAEETDLVPYGTFAFPVKRVGDHILI
jgi:hypothetical protein